MKPHVMNYHLMNFISLKDVKNIGKKIRRWTIKMNNDVIKGYTVLALKNLGYDLDKIDEVLNELYYLLDTKSEVEVEAYYRSLLWQWKN
mgnify:CR=1 FL=1